MNLDLQDLLAILGPLGTMSAFGWRKMDMLEKNLNQKIDTVNAKIDTLERNICKRLNMLETNLSKRLDKLGKR